MDISKSFRLFALIKSISKYTYSYWCHLEEKQKQKTEPDIVVCNHKPTQYSPFLCSWEISFQFPIRKITSWKIRTRPGGEIFHGSACLVLTHASGISCTELILWYSREAERGEKSSKRSIMRIHTAWVMVTPRFDEKSGLAIDLNTG